jgi:uncharacterized membrane protein YeaQ/YmgE (transglycosylase-associated protein family)
VHTLGVIIGTIVFGAVIGILARLVLPGRQRVSLLMTVVIGIIGALLGYWLAGLLGVNDTKGIDWIRWVISIAVAAVLVTAYERISASRGRTRA